MHWLISKILGLKKKISRMTPFSGTSPFLIATALFISAFFISILVFENSSEILRSFFQVTIVWIPLYLIASVSRLIKKWKKVLLFMASTAIGLVLLAFAGPFILGGIVLPQHFFDVDHRATYDPGKINRDGVQPDIPPKDYQKEDFNIIFLGDSFTYGERLDQLNQSFPFLVEKLLQARYPDKRVRAINFGWRASGPVLQYRQLFQIGEKYKPDLIVQSFDMTDFGNDIEHLSRLREANADDPGKISIFRAMKVRFSMFFGKRDMGQWLLDQLKGEVFKTFDWPGDLFYFHMWQPLEKSEPDFRITWKTLLDTNELAGKMGAKYVLFILPRCQQYNPIECPAPNEIYLIPEFGPYLWEPFKYFENQSKTAPFPIHSLLETFMNSGVSPTVFPTDPHYNEAGHRVAAKAIAEFIEKDDFIK